MDTNDGYSIFVIFIVIVALCVVGITTALGVEIYNACTNEQTVTETEIEVQITHLDQVSDNGHIKYYASITDFGDHADTMEITKEQYATYQVGDTITVICTVTENTKYANTIKYTIK